MAYFRSVKDTGGGGFSEALTIIFPSALIGEEWTCTAVGSGATSETYSGVVDSTLSATVTLTQPNTEYEITCGGTSTIHVSGGEYSLNFRDSSSIIPSLTSLTMKGDSYTDSVYGVTYNASASSTYGGRLAYCPFFSQGGREEPWQSSNDTSPWLMLHMSIPCKIRQFNIHLRETNSNMTFQGSTDGETWTTLHEFTSDELVAGRMNTINVMPNDKFSYYRWLSTNVSRVTIRQIVFTKVTE